MFAGVLAGRWPPAAALADCLLGPEHALPLRPATDRGVWGLGGTVDRCALETRRELTDPMQYDVWGERITRLDLTVAAPAGTLNIRITGAS
jgi:hypothetical protein